MRDHRRSLILPLMGILTLHACGAKQAPVLVAQSGLVVSRIIGELQVATKRLTDAQSIPPNVALSIQEDLLRLNERLKPLPDLLRAIDAAQQANDPALPLVDRVVAVLQVVGQDLSVVLTGVPVSETTKALIELVRSGQAAIQTLVLELARLRS